MVDGLGRLARQSFHARAGLTTLHGIWCQGGLCAGRERTRHLRRAALTPKTTIRRPPNASTRPKQVGIVATVSISLSADVIAFATGNCLPIASGLAVIPVDPGPHPIHRALILALGA